MSEKKYIDADWLSHWINEKLNAYRIINDCRDGKAIYDFIKNVLVPIVKTAPAADVAEIVRCKDCVLRNTEDCAMYYECDCGTQYSWETDNDYCSFGRKEVQE